MNDIAVTDTARYRRARQLALRMHQGERVSASDVVQMGFARAEANATMRLTEEIEQEMRCRWVSRIAAVGGGSDCLVGV